MAQKAVFWPQKKKSKKETTLKIIVILKRRLKSQKVVIFPSKQALLPKYPHPKDASRRTPKSYSKDASLHAF